jgi:lipopolysaccharide export system permease protein
MRSATAMSVRFGANAVMSATFLPNVIDTRATPYVNRAYPTLSIYLGRHFIVSFFSSLAVIVGLVLLFDTIELMRRSVSAAGIEFSTVFIMAVLKLPHTAQATLPFVVMMAMMFVLFRLSRTHELVIIRAAGVSVWQFLAPPLVLTAVLGLINLMIVDPLAANMYDSYQRMDDSLIRGQDTTLDIGENGLWLRDTVSGIATVVYAAAVRQDSDGLWLTKVSIFQSDNKERLYRRIEAASGHLIDGALKLEKVWDIVPGTPGVFHDAYALRTSITMRKVQDSFAAPETMSFWELSGFIRFSEAAGFSARPHKLYWYSLLASPWLLCAMVLIAASFNLTASVKLVGWTGRGVAGLGVGFLLYFFSRFLYALGLSATLPLVLAAWAPALVASMLGLAYLFHREDG